MKTFSLVTRTLLSAAALMTLSACGGGGGGDSTSSEAIKLDSTRFDSTAFQEIWKRNDRTVAGNPSNCFNFSDFGGTYGGLNRPSVITDTTVISTVEVYSDNTCATYLGLLVRNYSVSWSAGAVAGKTNVAKALVTSTGYSIQRDGAAGYSLTSPPASGVVTKTLFYVDGSLMYAGATGGTLDTDGYPTTLQATALYTR